MKDLIWVSLLLSVITGIKSQTIAVTPRNTQSTTGSDVTLNCKWDNAGAGAIIWRHFLTSGISGGTIITNNENINIGTNKYELSGNHPSGEFNLKIKSLQESDFGEYACTTQLGVLNKYGVYVSQLDIDTFVTNFGEANAELSKPVNLSCTVSYKAPGSWTPDVQIYEGSTSLATGTPSMGKIVATAQVASAVDGTQYSCVGKYGDPPAGSIKSNTSEHVYDPAAPDGTQTKNLTLSAQNEPTNIQFHPDKTMFEVGESIYVNASANPAPSYMWTRLQGGGPTSHTGQTLTIGESMGGSNEYTVSVTNVVLGSEKTNSRKITFQVTGGGNSAGGSGLGGSVHAGILVGVILFSLF